MTSKFANQNNRVVAPPSLSRGEISAIHKGIRATSSPTCSAAARARVTNDHPQHNARRRRAAHAAPRFINGVNVMFIARVLDACNGGLGTAQVQFKIDRLGSACRYRIRTLFNPTPHEFMIPPGMTRAKELEYICEQLVGKPPAAQQTATEARPSKNIAAITHVTIRVNIAMSA
jgi:hypothetical protein